MEDNAGITQRKGMAMDKGVLDAGDFGCQKLESMRGAEMPSPKGRTLDVDERAADLPVKHTRGKMPSQAEPDHGAHKY